jgi:hypothetical protein
MKPVASTVTRENNMIRRTVGVILTIIGGLVIVILLSYGGAILPHIVGPITIAAIGIVLVTLKRKGDHNG